MNTSKIILVAGPSASGKSTFANGLAERLKAQGNTCAVIALDNYYRDLSHMTPEARTQHDFDQPEAWEKERILSDTKALKTGKCIQIPIYDFNTHLRTQRSVTVEPNDFIILEGLFTLCYPELNSLADLKIFIDLSNEIALDRRIQRDTRERGRSRDSVIEQYIATVQPANHKYITPSASHADIRISGVKLLSEQIELVMVEDFTQRLGIIPQ